MSHLSRERAANTPLARGIGRGKGLVSHPLNNTIAEIIRLYSDSRRVIETVFNTTVPSMRRGHPLEKYQVSQSLVRLQDISIITDRAIAYWGIPRDFDDLPLLRGFLDGYDECREREF